MIKFLITAFLILVSSQGVQAQEHTISRDLDETYSIEGAVDQSKKLISILDRTLDDLTACGDAPGFELYDGTGCTEPEVDPVVEAHAKQPILDCPSANQVQDFDGTNWYCKTLTNVDVDCINVSTNPGGCTINFGEVEDSTTTSRQYCSIGAMSNGRGCYARASCGTQNGVQSFSDDECFTCSWQTGAWNVPCYDANPDPLVENWMWNRTVSCPGGCCDPAYEPASTGSCGAAPINGVCGGAVDSCSNGSYSDDPDTATDYVWSCNGSNGGGNATCTSPIAVLPVNGVCDTTVTNGCAAGTLEDVPDTTTDFVWNCRGTNGGTDAMSCSRPNGVPPANCFDSIGTAGCTDFHSINHGVSDSWSCDAGYTGSCNAECDNGSFINVSNTCTISGPDCAATNEMILSTPTGLTGRQASCLHILPDGMNGDTQSLAHNMGTCQDTIPMLAVTMDSPTCSAVFECVGTTWVAQTSSGSCSAAPVPVTGACATTQDNCSAGVWQDGTDTATQYRWTCLGQNGGSDSGTCTAPKAINGSCGTTNNACTAGTTNDIADTATQYRWTCLGQNGGTDSGTCTAPKAINGSCGTSNNACTAGTTNDIADTATQYRWTCLGQNGGSDSGTCTAAKAPSYTWQYVSGPTNICGIFGSPAGANAKTGACTNEGELWSYGEHVGSIVNEGYLQQCYSYTYQRCE